MEKIIKTTEYWLLKPTYISETVQSQYYYIRSLNCNVGAKPFWFIGYKNKLGLVSSVGGSLIPRLEVELEQEFQTLIKS